MRTSEKKTLLNIAYYSGVTLIIAFSILFMVALSRRGVTTYQQVIYYIWSSLLILTIIFDIIATMTNSMKFIVGLLVCGLVLLCIVVGIIVYATMSVNGLIPATLIEQFTLVITFSTLLSILTIATYCTSNHLIDMNVEKRTR